MPDIDALREAYDADRNPEFQDPDAYDVDEYLRKLEIAKDHVDEACGAVAGALDLRHTRKLEQVKNALDTAFTLLEEES